jgi:hypothetical protein
MRIVNDGNVGIGTTAPLSKLGILGNLSVGATYGNIAAPTSGLIVEGNIGIGTTSPTNALSFGSSQNQKIWIENTDATTAGKSLTLAAGSSGFSLDFAALSQTSRDWWGMAAAPNGDVYAAVVGGDIYKQTGGSGDFVALSQTSRTWRAMAAAPNGDVYAAVVGGDIYRQTGGTGNFVALGQTSRNWTGMAAAPNGDVYAAVWNGDIYKQTGGSGDFVALGQTSRAWLSMTAAPNGDIYAAVSSSGMYKQTGGTGDFVDLDQYLYQIRGMTAAPNGDIYAASEGGDIYRQTGGTGNFVALGQTSRNWTGMAAAPNGDVYAAVVGGDIYKRSGSVNLAGGSLILSSGVGTGEGASTISFFTGTTLGDGNTLQTLSEKMTILGSGNVGIGIINPLHKLDVVGNINISTGSTFKINGTDILSSTTLGTSVLTSSLTTVGALNSGSITSGFGSINVGADSITTTGTIGTASTTTFAGGSFTGTTGVFSTSTTTPLIIGGTAVGSSLTLQSTSGEGTTDFIKFAVGNNGATEAMRIINDGKVGIGTTSPSEKLTLAGGNFYHYSLGPTLKGTYDTSGTAYGVYALGDYVYVADGESGLQVVSVFNPASPSLAGTYDTSGTAYDVYVSGKYAYVADGASGLQIIDISNPASPSLAGTYDTSGTAYDVYVSGKYAYIADGASGLQIIDISNPASPSLAGTYDTSGTAYDVYVSGKYAYIADGASGLQIIDISDPSLPSLVKTYALLFDSVAASIHVSGVHAYVQGTNRAAFQINISNPDAPTYTDISILSGSSTVLPMGSFVSGNYAYHVDGVMLHQSHTSTQNYLATATGGTAHGVYISGKYVYVAAGTAGLQVLEQSGISTPSLYAGSIETGVLSARENIDVGNNLFVRNGLNVGPGGIYSGGLVGIGVSAAQPALSIIQSGTGAAATFMGGNIGIGTTAPLSKLGVLGNLSIGATYGNIAAPTSGLIVEGSIGIGTTSPTNALSFGSSQNQKIWIENTDATTAGKSLTLTAGSTVASATSPDFLALSQASRHWEVMAAAPNGDVYAVASGDIYKQTGGTGDFVALSQTSRGWTGMTAAPNGDVYAAVDGGDIYKQTGGTGDFVALSQTSRRWYGMAAAPNGDVYAAASSGDIYKQTGGSGDFVALGQTSRSWWSMAAAPNGDVYAGTEWGDIYKQTGGTGDFVALGQTSRWWTGMAAAPNGDVYASVFDGDIYKQTGGSGNFVALGQTSRWWYGMAAAPNGDVYASVYMSGDIYKQTNSPYYNLAGGSLIFSSGLGKGTGASTISFFTSTTLSSSDALQTLSEKMTILGSGNVGIGIINPLHKLDVVGNINISTGSTFKINGTDILSSTTLGTSVLTSSLTTVGALNNGSITSGFGSINVGADSITTTGTIGTASTTTFAGGSFTGTTGVFSTSTTTPLIIGGTAVGSSLTLQSTSGEGTTDFIKFAVGNNGATEAMRITSDGRIGIGTAEPNNLLQVADLINFNNTDFNTLLGFEAGKNVVTGAQYNTFIGYRSGYFSASSNSTADFNTAVGRQTLYSNTRGYANNAFGASALYSNTEGFSNNAFGASALYSNTEGYFNNAFGASALYSNTGSYNNAFGYQSLYSNTITAGNNAFGYQSLYSNTLGLNNIGLGHQAGYFSQTGNYNIFIGYKAGYGAGSVVFTGANNNTIIGNFAGYNLGTNNVGNVYLGFEAGYSETGSDKLYISNSSTTNLIYGDFSTGTLSLGGTNTLTSPTLFLDSSGFVGIGTANPLDLLTVTGSVYLGGATDGITITDTDIGVGYGPGSTGSGNIPLSISAGGSSDLTLRGGNVGGNIILQPEGGYVGIGTNNPVAPLTIFSDDTAMVHLQGDGNGFNYSGIALSESISGQAKSWNLIHRSADGQVNNFAIEEYDGSTWYLRMNILPGGNIGIGTTDPTSLLHLSSTSTSSSFSGFALDWLPTTPTVLTGDLFTINLGADGSVSNIFNIKKDGSSLFSVSESVITANLPTAFNAAGDVSIAYDLAFTNPTTSYIKSSAPLYLEAGEPFNSSNLTLRTFNSGDIILESAKTEVTGLLGISTIEGAGLSSCNSASSKLLYNSTTKQFECGTDQTGSGDGGEGGYLGTTVLTSGTSFTTKAETATIKIKLVGGGGGGGGATATTNQTGLGSGGGSGSYAEKTFTVNPTTAYTYSVGTGGSGGAGANVGTNGANSTFTVGATTVTAYGGSGGGNLAAGTTLASASGGTGGSLSANGDLNIAGQDGGGGIRRSGNNAGGNSGKGADSLLGLGGVESYATGASTGGSGGNATGYGAGGGGAASGNNGNQNGGNGSAGAIIVEEYSGTSGADLAEWYETKLGVKAGDLVSMSSETLIYNTSSGLQRISVLEKATPGSQVIGVISSYPHTIMGRDIKESATNPQPLALTGRIPVNVSTENGPIQRGDYLTASSAPGVAMKATKAGLVIGRALEEFNGQGVGKVLVFVGVSYADPSNILANLTLDADGTLLVPKLKVGSLAIDETILSLQQQNGALVSSITNIGIKVNEVSNTTVTLAEQIENINNAQTILSEKMASQATTLAELAEKEASNSAAIADLQTKLDALLAKESTSSGKIGTNSEVEELNLTAPEIMLNNDATFTTLSVTEAISTASLATLNLAVSGIFKSYGETFLADTNIAGNLTVDGTMTITGDSINSLGTLYIQSSPLAEFVDIFNGLVTIDKTGKVVAVEIVTDVLTITATKKDSSENDPTIGSGKIETGELEVAVFTNRVTSNSKIFVQPRSKTGGQPLNVIDIVESAGFVVTVEKPFEEDITFDWWVIGTK